MRLAAFWPITSRVAGPRALRLAPFADCSAPDTWHLLPSLDYSSFDIVCPAAATDLTRLLPLNALLHPQIAPLPIHCARVVDRLLCVQRLKLSHRLQITPYTILCVPRRLWIAPLPALSAHTARELLRMRHLTLRDGLRIAPYATPLRPCVVHGLLRARRFKLRTVHRLLRVRRLTLDANCRFLSSPHSASGAARGYLRVQHFRALHRIRSTPVPTLITPPLAPITRCKTLGICLSLRISPQA